MRHGVTAGSMSYLLWSLPTLAVALPILSGRVKVTYAALLGLLVAVPVAVFSGPSAFGAQQLAQALARGLWLGFTVAPYILGGLLFWQIAVRDAEPTPADAPASANSSVPNESPTSNGLAPSGTSALARRRQAFFACFLIGPFAESATGFGVGMLGTVALLRRFDLAPRHLMVFALLSQSLIPWGAMGSGTMLAAAYARISPTQLALYSLLPVALLMLVWLALFWRTARAAGLLAPRTECAREAGWIAAALTLLALTTLFLGPETALLAAFAPLIVLRHAHDQRPDRRRFLNTARRGLPYLVLIGALVLVRLLPGVRESIGSLLKLAPYPDLPSWSPFLHAGSWLIAGAVLTALARRQSRLLAKEARAACTTGKHAVLTMFAFAMMAEVLSMAGIARAFAAGMFAAFGSGAVLLAPLVSGAFGILANSGTPPNSLFMPSQLVLAIQAGLSIPAVAALQHVCASSLGLFAPVRMSIAAGLSRGIGQEHAVYVVLLPYAVASVALLSLCAGLALLL